MHLAMGSCGSSPGALQGSAVTRALNAAGRWLSQPLSCLVLSCDGAREGKRSRRRIAFAMLFMCQ